MLLHVRLTSAGLKNPARQAPCAKRLNSLCSAVAGDTASAGPATGWLVALRRLLRAGGQKSDVGEDQRPARLSRSAPPSSQPASRASFPITVSPVR
jgi:hypothetical protein